jgi:hypothetical protein
MPIGEADRNYIGAALRSVWFYISVSLGLIGLLERWRAMPFLVPHWAIFSLIVVSLIGAHFEVYKKQFDEMRTLKKKPERNPFQEKQYQRIKDILSAYDEKHKAVLSHLLIHGKMTKVHGGKLSPLPTGFWEELAAKILDKLISDQLVVSEGGPYPGGWQASWQISPEIRSLVEELL